MRRISRRPLTVSLVALLLVAACTAGPSPAVSPGATSAPPSASATPASAGTPGAPCSRPTDGAASAGGWWNDRVFYEVFVRSFADGDGDGIGDLRGLTARLDYLNDGDPASTTDLGVTGLWLMPVTQATSYHGYDVVDYRTVEKEYGTNEDFREFLEAAHRRGIAVIIDLVMNHTSRQHPWFLDARTPGSPHDGWYVWAAEPPDYAGPGGQPAWFKAGDRYYYAAFGAGLPDLNLRNPAVTHELDDVARFWLDTMGVDGFRLDAAKHLIEDGPRQENTPETHAWLRDFHRFVRSAKGDALLVGEIYDLTETAASYVPDDVDLAFEFGLARATLDSVRRGDAGGLATAQAEALACYPPGQYAAFLTNHDQERVMSQLEDPAEAKLAATLLLTNPGVPFVYYGEEIGIRGTKPDEEIRTPMAWDATLPAAGFSTAAPWEPLAPRSQVANVAVEETDPSSVLNHYRKLIRLREDHPALTVGDFVPVTSDTPALYAFLRHAPGETLLLVANLSGQPVTGYRLTLASGPLTGPLHPVLLLGAGQPAAPLVNGAGGFDAYAPLPVLPPRTGLVVGLAP